MGHEEVLACHTTMLTPAGQWTAPSEGWVLAQATAGIAYCRHPMGDFEIPSGAVLLAAPLSSAVVLASQLGPVDLRWFGVRIDYLAGLMTFSERRRLESLADGRPKPQVFISGHVISQEFNRLFHSPPGSPFLARCCMIHLMAESLAGSFGFDAKSTETTDDARRRVRLWLSQHPEAELIERSIDDLAEETGCSVRHFSRVFRDETGQSFRARQTELRLVRVSQLLRGSDAKIIEIALEGGYRHLGLFNALFKRRFGMTPTTWRRQAHETRSRRRAGFQRTAALAGFMLALFFAGGLPAADPVPTPAPATNAPAKPSFPIRSYEISGNSLLPTTVIQSVLQPFTGEAIDFDTIRKGLAALQLEYRARGFATVSLNLPPQTLTNGIVHVQVIEGRLVEINVTGNRWFDTNNVRRALPGLRTNIFLNSKLFQQELDVANANRDRQIYPQILPGPEPGTSAVLLKVKDQIPLHGRFELNNLALPGTPELRGNATLQYNNLWQCEHSFGLQYGFSPQAFRDRADWEPFDRPLVASYSAFYRFPISDPESLPEVAAADPRRFGWDEGSRRFRLPPASPRSEINLYASRFNLDSGVQFSPLVQLSPPPIALYTQDSGRNTTIVDDLGARWSQPLPELAGWKPTLQAGLDLKFFEFASYNTNNFATEFLVTNTTTGEVIPNRQEVASPQPTHAGSITYLPISVRVNFSRSDKSGSTSLGIGLVGNIAGRPFSTTEDYNNAGGAGVDGSFIAIQGSAVRDQKIHGDWTVQFRADGQWVNHSVLSLERFSLAGSQGVRGYQEGSSFGDRGWRVVAEPHTPTFDLGLVDGRLPLQLRGMAFVDYGENYTADPNGPDVTTRLAGTGMGFSGGIGTTFDFRATIGWALTDGAQAHRGDFRVYFGIGAQF